MYWYKSIISTCICITVFLVSHNKSSDNLLNIAAVLASISGALMGFLIAALSILTSLVDSRLIINMNKTGHYSVLLKELYITAASFLAVLIIGIITLFLDAIYLVIGISLSTGIFSLAIQFLISVGCKFSKVMRHASKK